MADQQGTEQLAEHVEASVEALVQLHSDHYKEASRLQRTIDGVIEVLGRPLLAFLLILLLCLAVVAAAFAMSIEGAVFKVLEFAATAAALGLALLILASQRRENELEEGRAKLTLELALLADRRTAKIIALLEELRRDTPMIADRVDPESEDMAAPTDAGAVMEAIEARTPKASRDVPTNGQKGD